MVLGHVDAVGRIVAARHEGESVVFTIEVPEPLMVYMAEKGSVAVDGISLTIAASAPGRIEVALIPHTLGKTTMAVKRVGDRVNIECDVLARYLVHLLRSDPSRPEQARGESLLDRLARAGF